MDASGGRFRRADRLLKSGEFRRVSATGQRRAGPLVIVLHAERGKCEGERRSGPRLGVTVSRKVGGSVVRNRVKRVLREWFRHARSHLPAETDWVLIARSGAAKASSARLMEQLDQLIGISRRCHG